MYAEKSHLEKRNVSRIPLRYDAYVVILTEKASKLQLIFLRYEKSD